MAWADRSFERVVCWPMSKIHSSYRNLIQLRFIFKVPKSSALNASQALIKVSAD